MPSLKTPIRREEKLQREKTLTPNSIAGSETTATALSCMTYYLLKNPPIMARLQEEVRSAFSRYEEIDSASTIPLKYLKAVAQEAMRIYPPLPFALPRVVPEPGCHVDGQFLPGGVRIPFIFPPMSSSSMVFFPTDGVCMHSFSYRLSFPPALSLQVCLLQTSIDLGSLSLSVGWRRARAPMLLRPVSHFPTGVEHVSVEGT